MIEQFERADAPAPWVFSNGPEFPGAKGSLSPGAGHSGTGAHLAYDTRAGGNYVSATDLLPAPVAAGALRLWVKHPGGMRIQIRVNDSTGQTLQYSLNRPFDAADPQQWYRLVVGLDPTSEHWGGRVNDGKLHGAVTSIGVLAQPGTNKVGAVDFDDIELLDALPKQIDPAAAPVMAAAVTDFCGSLGVEITHLEATEEHLRLAQSLGFARLRTELFWADVERTPGVYDFSWSDKFVADLKQHGLQAHFILCYGNPVYTGTPWLQPPLTTIAVAAFGNFARAAAERYAGQGARFEVWNEPNNPTYWGNRPKAAEFGALCRVAAGQLHVGDPAAQAATGGLAGVDPSFLDATVAAGGMSGADAIGIHPYRFEAPEGFSVDLLDLRTRLAQAFPNRPPPVWSTEAGYSSAWYGDGSSAPNRIRQAKFSVRQMLTGLALGLPSQTFFALVDHGTNVRAIEENFGIVDRNDRPKPLTAAVRTLLAQCRGRTFAGVLPSPQTSLHVLKFQGASDTLLVLWSESSAGAGQEILFPQRPARALDYLGGSLGRAASGTKGYPVKVADAPVYITFRSRF